MWSGGIGRYHLGDLYPAFGNSDMLEIYMTIVHDPWSKSPNYNWLVYLFVSETNHVAGDYIGWSYLNICKAKHFLYINNEEVWCHLRKSVHYTYKNLVEVRDLASRQRTKFEVLTS